MSHEPDRELEAWSAAWRQGAGAGPERGKALALLERRVRRRSLGLALLTAFEVALAVTAVAVLAALAARDPSPVNVATMAGLAVLALAALVYGLWNRRGVWRPEAATAAAFLDLSLARCRRRRRTLLLGYALVAGEVALFVPWIAYVVAARTGGPVQFAQAYGFLAAVAGAVVAALAWLQRRTRRELRELETLRRNLREE